MIKYLMSITIFYIILKATEYICRKILKEKGRLEKVPELKENSTNISTLIISCIPIFRILVVIAMFYMCFCNDEDFEDFINKD